MMYGLKRFVKQNINKPYLLCAQGRNVVILLIPIQVTIVLLFWLTLHTTITTKGLNSLI